MSSVAIAAALLTLGASAAQAANWYVDPLGNDSNSCTAPGPTSACKTITAAMTKASAGDTINVAIGLYNEQVQITKTLTLLGAQNGVDARTRIADQNPHAHVVRDRPDADVRAFAEEFIGELDLFE